MTKRISTINIDRKDWRTKVSRYLDFSRFVALLETRSLHFSHVDMFQDAYDGIFNCLGKDDYYTVTNGKIVTVDPSAVTALDTDNSAKIKAFVTLHHSAYLRATGVSCWRIDDQESHAMWRVFLNSNEGLAIETTLTNLIKAFSREELSRKKYNLVVGKVKYIEYTKQKIPIFNLINPFFYKSKYFEHERELRLTCYARDAKTEVDEIQDLRPLPVGGLQLPVDLSKLITAIRVSPYAQEWFLSLVKDVAKRYGLNDVPIRPSIIALKK